MDRGLFSVSPAGSVECLPTVPLLGEDLVSPPQGMWEWPGDPRSSGKCRQSIQSQHMGGHIASPPSPQPGQAEALLPPGPGVQLA